MNHEPEKLFLLRLIPKPSPPRDSVCRSVPFCVDLSQGTAGTGKHTCAILASALFARTRFNDQPTRC